jgi:hypothetical protein
MLPFTREAFLQVFAAYNAVHWPASLAAYLIAALSVLAILMKSRGASSILFVGLTLMWAWTGLFYHLSYFRQINGAAAFFGFLFLAGAGCFLLGAAKGIEAARWMGWRSALGWALVAYALAGYPLLGLAQGHSYGQIPQFGITPCPTVLFTLGALLLLRQPVPLWLLAVPLVWSLIGGTAAFLLNVPQDWPLLFAGVIAVAVLAWDGAL